MTENNIHILKLKINQFIDKYYKNSLLKGTILSITIIFIVIILFSIVEYLSWNTSSVRLSFLIILILSVLLIFGYFVFIPLIRKLGILSRISEKHAALIIKRELKDIDDSIINALELSELENKDELVNASINQKIDKLNSYSFTDAINLKHNYKFLKHLGLIVILGIVIGIIQPGIYKDGTKRIINYRMEYVKDFGYKFYVDTNNLFVEKGKDLEIRFECKGNKTPDYVNIRINGNDFITKKHKQNYIYLFKGVNQSFNFKIVTEKFVSESYKINVLESPVINGYKVHLTYPKYTGIDSVILNNQTNVKVPIGTKVQFQFSTNKLDTLYFITNKNNKRVIINNKHTFIADSSITYTVSAIKAKIKKSFFNQSKINVIPDEYPSIKVAELKDSTRSNVIYFKGIIADDYGLTHLYMNVNGSKISIPINKNMNNQEFYYSYIFDKKLGKDYYYNFEVFDNDGYNGIKSVKTQKKQFSVPTLNELAENEKEDNKKLLEELEKSAMLSQEIKRDIKELNKRLITEKLDDWEKENLINDIVQKENELEKLINSLKATNKSKDIEQNSLKNNSEEILKKQEEIDELLNQIMDKELKDLLKELQELREMHNKDIKEQLDKLDFKYDDLNKELNKNLELLKKYKLETEVQTAIDRLNEISENQKSMADSGYNEQQNNKDIENLEDIKENYEETLKENEELEKPMDLDDFENEFDDLKNDLQKNNSDSSSEKSKQNQSQKNSKKSKELADKMSSMMQSNSQKEDAENAETLRQVLENLFYYSFTQENLNNEFRKVTKNSSNYLDLKQEQSNLQNNFKIIKDSLYALSKRTKKVGNHINETTFNIDYHLYKGKELLDKDQINSARNDLRLSMQYANDLIVLLTESLKNMDSMGSGGSGSQNSRKKKPSKGKPNSSDIRSMQQGMKEQLKSMLNQMKNGSKPGSSQYGKMLAKHEIMQQMLNEMQMKSGFGNKEAKLLNEINNLMEQNKRDIINYNISQNTLYRQKKIETRLLEAENAEQEREKDNKRKSKEVLNYSISNPKEIFEKNNKTDNFNEIIEYNNLILSKFYTTKYQEYINKLKTLPNE